MPNVRHEESLEGFAIPEFIQIVSPPPVCQETEEDAAQKTENCSYSSQYREDQ
jgi:hypothetical protein